jgi:hypothetical protein
MDIVEGIYENKEGTQLFSLSTKFIILQISQDPIIQET